MKDFRLGYLYSLSPIHCGGEGDIGNILEISREVHTDFPYIPGSSLRGSIRDELEVIDPDVANKLFGKELDDNGQMGVHQVWFGDARLLWIPMRTMSCNNRDVFTWVSCHSLIRDHAILGKLPFTAFRNFPVGTKAGTYEVADAQINVTSLNEKEKEAIKFLGEFPTCIKDTVKPAWTENHLILPDADFQILMEHSLWTQVRNKIDNKVGSAEVFWTDICIPRDTIFYYPWGYQIKKDNSVIKSEHDQLIKIITQLIQVGGQANVGRGWVQSWVSDKTFNFSVTKTQPETATVGI